jgi:hypothetical protein
MRKEMEIKLTYENCEATFSRRIKSNDFKAVMRGCHLTHNKETDEFKIEYVGYQNAIPICKINRENVVTFLTDGRDDITIRNRLSWILHTAVYQDVSRHRTKESSVRISTRRNRKWADRTSTSIPCYVGMQFQMDKDGMVDKILNKKPDAKILVKKSIINEARKNLKSLFETMIVTEKLGGYDKYFKQNYQWNFELTKVGDLEAICKRLDQFEPQDVTTVYLTGLFNVNMWSIEGELFAKVRKDAVRMAMKLMRKAYYKVNDGYERIELTN